MDITVEQFVLGIVQDDQDRPGCRAPIIRIASRLHTDLDKAHPIRPEMARLIQRAVVDLGRLSTLPCGPESRLLSKALATASIDEIARMICTGESHHAAPAAPAAPVDQPKSTGLAGLLGKLTGSGE